MTIAVGLLCDRGAVVGADRQWTAGDWKLDGGKIAFGSQAVGSDRLLSFVAAGSGSSRAMISGATKAVEKSWRQSNNVQELIDSADTELAAFYQKRIVPFVNAYGIPNTDVLIAASSTGSRVGLWQTEDYALVSSDPYCAIGTGRMFALTLLNRAYPSGIRIGPFAAAILAVDTLAQVKDSDTNCGKDSDIFFLLGDSVCPVDRTWVRNAQALCERFASFATPGFLLRAIGEWGMDANASLDGYSKAFRELGDSLYASLGLSKKSDQLGQ